VDVNFTAEMENDLDKVEEGKEEWTTVVDRF
jgi:DNA topoisomerase-1